MTATLTAAGGPILTRPHAAGPRSGLDPVVQEVSWMAVEMVAAAPSQVTSEGAVHVAASFVDRIIESAWLPGRLSAITEIAVTFEHGSPRLRVVLACGVFGSTGSTAAEAAALARLVDQRVHSGALPYRAQAVDPRAVLDIAPDDAAHCAVVRQRTVTIESDLPNGDIEVLSRFNPVVAPWSQIATALLTRDAPTRVRATVMPTEVAVTDRMQIEAQLVKAHRMLDASENRPDVRLNAERAVETLVDLGASLSTPGLCVEIAIASRSALEELFVRHIGSCFTSETGVLRQRGHTVVAGQRIFLGGFDVERAPRGLADALRTGLPLRGGLGPRGLVDLITLTECPLGWPIPAGGPIPTIPTGALRSLQTPATMHSGIPIGTGVRGEPVHLPLTPLERHAFLCGATGTGKSTVLTACAIDDLRQARPFLLVDWHGRGADRVLAFADDLHVPVASIDPDDAGSAILRLLPRLDDDASNRNEVEDAASRIVDAIAASLPKDWTGPRFIQVARALLVLVMVHGAEIADGVEWVDNLAVLRSKLDHPLLPRHYASVLLTLHAPGGDAATTRDWVTSKFQPFLSATTRRVVARAGEGRSIAELVAAGTPIIVNLATMADSDGRLVGHLITQATFDAAMARPAASAKHMRAYLDEAQKLVVAGMQRIQTEGRKFGLSLMCATQSMSQLDPVLADLAGSAAVLVAFRQTPASASALAAQLGIQPHDLTDLPDLSAYVKVTGEAVGSVTVNPYSPCPPIRVKQPPTVRPLVAVGSDAATPRASQPDPEPDRTFFEEWLAKRAGA